MVSINVLNVNQDAGTLPEIVFIEALSKAIGKTATTIRTCATNEKYKHLIPRPYKLPNSRRLCWTVEDVQAWMEGARQVNPAGKRGRGRPTKKETLERQAASLTA